VLEQLKRPALQPAHIPARRERESRPPARRAASKHPAERQADELGERVGRQIGAGYIANGPIPDDVRAAGEEQLGVDLDGATLQEEGAELSAAPGALAVTEGSAVRFASRQLSRGSDRGRALLGHELVHVAQQRSAGVSVPQHQDAAPMTLAPPAAHAGRLEQLKFLAAEISFEREFVTSLEVELSALPQLSSVDPEEQEARAAQERQLKNEITFTRESLVGLFDRRITVFDDAIADLNGVLASVPQVSEQDAPDPSGIFAEIHRLARERETDRKERLAVERAMARAELRELAEQLARLPAESSEEREELEARRKALAEFLSGTAEQRTPPGTHGRGSDGRCYTVFQHEVRIGGSIPWRFKNPGNIGPFPGKEQPKDWPPGAIGFARPGTICGFGGRVGFFIFSSPFDGRTWTERWMNDAADQGQSVGAFLLAYSGEGQTYLDRIAKIDAGIDFNRSMTSVRGDSAAWDRLKAAMFRLESGAATGGEAGAGEVITCANVDSPPEDAEYRKMLGCDE
jgi:hypothetical protein